MEIFVLLFIQSQCSVEHCQGVLHWLNCLQKDYIRLYRRTTVRLKETMFYERVDVSSEILGNRNDQSFIHDIFFLFCKRYSTHYSK